MRASVELSEDLHGVVISYEDSGRIAVSIDTPRASIHSYQGDDFEDYVALLSDPRIVLFYDEGVPKERSQIQEALRIAEKTGFSSGRPFGFFSLFEKESGQFMGLLDFLATDCEGVFEIGIALLRKFQGRRFVNEILNSFLGNYIEFINQNSEQFDWPSVKTIIATSHPRNLASKRLIEEFGFKYQTSQPRFGNPRLWYALAISPDASFLGESKSIPEELYCS